MRSLVSRALSLRASRSRFLISAAALLVVLSSLAVGPVVAHDTVAGPADVTITIRSGLSDRDVRVRVGAIVRFVNSDDDRHRMRSRSGPHEFDTGNIEPGEAYQIRLSAAGTYTYIDERNDDASAYRGRIVVAASGGTSTASGGSTAAAGGSAAGGGAASSATVSIGDDFYQPTSVQIAAGGSVTFRNTGGDEHSATSSAFNTGVLAGGASARKTFTSAGTFDFLCMFHSDMRGTIQVVAAGTRRPRRSRVAPRPMSHADPDSRAGRGRRRGRRADDGRCRDRGLLVRAGHRRGRGWWLGRMDEHWRGAAHGRREGRDVQERHARCREHVPADVHDAGHLRLPVRGAPRDGGHGPGRGRRRSGSRWRARRSDRSPKQRAAQRPESRIRPARPRPRHRQRRRPPRRPTEPPPPQRRTCRAWPASC